jgi:hypothetical protein
MPLLRTVTFSYRWREDRVLAAVNLGHPDAWSCWITRRLALAMIKRAAEFLANTSPLKKRVAADHHGELAQFENEAAMASTAKGLSVASSDALKASSTVAELAERVTFTNQGEKFKIELFGDRSGSAIGVVPRPDFQRILRMLEVEVEKAEWIASSVHPAVTATRATSVHH